MNLPDLKAQLHELVGHTACGDENARIAALERFDELGLPDRRVETWHYTDIQPLGGSRFRYAVPPPDAATLDRVAAALPPRLPDSSGQRLVFVDGHLSAAHSSGLEAEHIAVEQLATDSHLQSETAGLTALNAAFAPCGHLLRLSKSSEQPIELIHLCTGQGLAPQAQLRIELEDTVRATIVERFIDLPGASEAWLNYCADIDLARGSYLTWYRVQTKSNLHFLTGLQRASLAEDAQLTVGNLELGGALVRNEIQIALKGERAEADIFSLSLTSGQQHVDTRFAIDHQAPRTGSRQNQGAILADASRAVFNGKVTVQQHAQHIEARQRSDCLLLSSKAEADTKPELEIYADQVICSHGATIGQLSDDHLFYLRARGIDEATARGILTTAFADRILKRIRLSSLRDETRNAVGAWLTREAGTPREAGTQ